MSTDFLYARPSLLSGWARLLDLAGQFDDYNRSATPAEADLRAIRSDWIITGEDLARAIAAYRAQLDQDDAAEPQQPALPWVESELGKAR